MWFLLKDDTEIKPALLLLVKCSCYCFSASLPLSVLEFCSSFFQMWNWDKRVPWATCIGRPGRDMHSSSPKRVRPKFSFHPGVCILHPFPPAIWKVRCKAWGQQPKPLTSLGLLYYWRQKDFFFGWCSSEKCNYRVQILREY